MPKFLNKGKITVEPQVTVSVTNGSISYTRKDGTLIEGVLVSEKSTSGGFYDKLSAMNQRTKDDFLNKRSVQGFKNSEFALFKERRNK